VKDGQVKDESQESKKSGRARLPVTMKHGYFLVFFFSRFSARFSFSVLVGFFFVSFRASCDFAIALVDFKCL